MAAWHFEWVNLRHHSGQCETSDLGRSPQPDRGHGVPARVAIQETGHFGVDAYGGTEENIRHLQDILLAAKGSTVKK